jgi:tetratricopeptide (TPR) repeat protein
MAGILMLASLGCHHPSPATQPAPHLGSESGTVHFPVSCAPRSQPRFDHAVALLHNMTYPEARQEFEAIAAGDTLCAMAHWGIAMTLFQPLWPTRPSQAALARGWAETERARTLLPGTARESLFVASTAAFFLEPASPDYWLRVRRWGAATTRLFDAFPDDPEATAFFALALLATPPTDSLFRPNADRAAQLLRGLWASHPDHPGAMHYLIHADDMPGRERESPEVLPRYEAAAPDNPHALHMPTHVYTRLGDWDGVIRGNLRAAEAALRHPAGDHGELVWDEFPHAIEYLVYADLQKAAETAAATQIRRLQGTAALEPSFKTAFHLASVPTRYALERHAWREAAALAPRQPATLEWDRFAWPEAVVQFGRGLGMAHLGMSAGVDSVLVRLATLEATTRSAGEDVFARNIRMLSLELEAWRAQTLQQPDSAVTLMRAAAALEAATPKPAVTPAPTLPAEELLGDLYLEQSRPAEALEAYRRSLALYPRRFNSLLGAARASAGKGDTPRAREYYAALAGSARGGTRVAALREAGDYLARTH